MENMRAFTFGVVFIMLTACSDKAQPDYAKCVQADTTGDLAGAVKACSDAIGADPNSTSGKAAAAKLAEIKPKYDAWKADQDAKAAAAAEAKRAADAVQAKAQAEARAAQAKAEAEARQAAVADLRRRVKGLFAYDNKPDSRCLAEGKPPYARDYGGGTYDENEEVALADRCVHLFGKHMDHSPNDNSFCCPK
jgi:hypothetical protein